MWCGEIECLPNLPDSYTRGWWWRRHVSSSALALVFTLPVCPTLSVLSLFIFSLTLLSPSEHQNHARELVKKADLSQCDALVIMSGDGLLFEVHFTQPIVVSWRYDNQYRGFERPRKKTPQRNKVKCSTHHYMYFLFMYVFTLSWLNKTIC